MEYNKCIVCTEPISGTRFDLCVLASAPREEDGFTYPPAINVQINSVIAVHLRMTPADAMTLASHLALAAINAERGEAEIIEFTLDKVAA